MFLFSFPFNAEAELFTPKIDLFVFNESHGSRKQTFFRLHFIGSCDHLHHQHSSPSSEPFIFPPRPLDLNPKLDEENSVTLSLLKTLFNIDDSMSSNPVEDEPYDDKDLLVLDDKDLVPVQIEYPNGNSSLQDVPINIANSIERKKKCGRLRKDESGNWLVKSEPLAVEEYKETKTLNRPNKTVDVGEYTSIADTDDGSSSIGAKRRRGRP